MKLLRAAIDALLSHGHVVIWIAAALHFIWAPLLLLDDKAAMITSIHGFVSFVEIFGLHLVPGIHALILVVASFLSLEALRRPPSIKNWLLVVPQQVIVMTTAAGGWVAIMTGHYADGYPAPRAFIAADQIIFTLVGLAHTLAVMFGGSRRKDA